jgi:putative hydrolase of HD superfamily
MTTSSSQNILAQFAFLTEMDRLKSITRQSFLIEANRRENSAEHSWHLAMFALVLGEHVEGVDVSHVIKMLLVHDIVEIDVGDFPIHRVGIDREMLEQKERAAANRIFGLLPPRQAEETLGLWLEFEAAMTPEARFAKSLDRLQPLLLNTLTNGGTWTENGVTEQQVIERYGPMIEGGSPELWSFAVTLVKRHFEAQASSG